MRGGERDVDQSSPSGLEWMMWFMVSILTTKAQECPSGIRGLPTYPSLFKDNCS